MFDFEPRTEDVTRSLILPFREVKGGWGSVTMVSALDTILTPSLPLKGGDLWWCLRRLLLSPGSSNSTS